jgi:hypothetical protein
MLDEQQQTDHGALQNFAVTGRTISNNNIQLPRTANLCSGGRCEEERHMSEGEQSVRTLDPAGDTWLAVRHHADGQGQDILVEATLLGERLAWLLAAMHGAEQPEVQQVGEQPVLAVPHSPELDGHLVQLIDLFIELRWAHPRLVQLELDLGDDEALA